MALDEAVAAFVRRGLAPPTLRLYAWDAPSVTLGCFQRSADLDLGYCRETGIPVVRRPTGGRAVLHGNELTYSFSAQTAEKPFRRNLRGTYRGLSSAFSLAFRAVGLSPHTVSRRRTGTTRSPLCFQAPSFGEITLAGRKVIGSAQRRWQDGFLQQGSIPYDIDPEIMGRVFALNGSAGAALHSMAGLREILPSLRDDELRRAVRAAFEEVLGVALRESSPREDEESLARELLKEKYGNPEWNLRR
jgi:lipoate-protein ligase A